MTLHEYLNTSLQTSLRAKRHENFVTDIKSPSCAIVQTLPYRQRCEYVRSTEQCGENLFIFNYVEIFFCEINSSNSIVMVLGLLMLLLLCIIIFAITAITADGFFCPSLRVLAMRMGISEHVAGVTLLAFGNSAPDVFTAFAGLNVDARLLHSDILGASIFIALVVSGVIAILDPFVLRPALFVRDVCFLILAIIYIDYAIKTDNYVTIGEAITILVIYFCYIAVVIADQFLLKIITRKPLLMSLQSQGTIDMFRRLKVTSDATIRMSSRPPTPTPDFQHTSDSYNTTLWAQLWISLNPISLKKWQQSGHTLRVLRILGAPVVFCLKLLIPVVDYELPLNGWSKLLNCAQLVMLPSTVCLFIVGPVVYYHLPIFIMLSIFTIPLAIYVFCVTGTDETPKHHTLFSVLGIAGSVYVIYACAKETISILDVLGITTSRSNAFLGTTLLAWGNSMGDLIANIALSRQGYQKMAFAACFGGPLFNCLICIGASYVYKASKDPNQRYEVSEGPMGENCTVFLAIGMSVLLFAATTTNFVMRRSIGVFLILMYAICLVYAILAEWEHIHPYGSAHRFNLKVEPAEI